MRERREVILNNNPKLLQEQTLYDSDEESPTYNPQPPQVRFRRHIVTKAQFELAKYYQQQLDAAYARPTEKPENSSGSQLSANIEAINLNADEE